VNEGLLNVAERITETVITSIVPTLITQESSLYPKLLSLLKPFHTATSATLLGWHAEGPFLEMEKRGAHAPPFLQTAPEGFKSFEGLYGVLNLADKEDWLMEDDGRDLWVSGLLPLLQRSRE
jgi:N-acetylglucosamine-6-phosphate deacetylase